MNQNLIHLFLSCMLILSFAGCSRLHDTGDDALMSYGNRSFAKEAWEEEKEEHEDEEDTRDYGSGFKKGYADAIAAGRSSQFSPSSHPWRYDSYWYQNNWGKGKKRRWHQGYRQGIMAANQDGFAHVNYYASYNRPLHSTSPSQSVSSPQTESEKLTPQAEEEPLPAPATEQQKQFTSDQTPTRASTVPSTGLPVSPTPKVLEPVTPRKKPLLPISSPIIKDAPQYKLKESSLTPGGSADFSPFEDDTPDLNPSENLEIEQKQPRLTENSSGSSQPSSIIIRPAQKHQQVLYEEEAPVESDTDNPYGIKISPGIPGSQSGH